MSHISTCLSQVRVATKIKQNSDYRGRAAPRLMFPQESYEQGNLFRETVSFLRKSRCNSLLFSFSASTGGYRRFSSDDCKVSSFDTCVDWTKKEISIFIRNLYCTNTNCCSFPHIFRVSIYFT